MKLTLWLNNTLKNRGTEEREDKTSPTAGVTELEEEADDTILKAYEVSVPEVSPDLQVGSDDTSSEPETSLPTRLLPTKDVDIGKFAKPDRQKPKNKAMYLCLLVNDKKEVKRIPVEIRERVYREPGSLGISYGLIEDGELECIIKNVFNGILVDNNEMLEFCYTPPKGERRYTKLDDNRFKQFIELKFNKALNAYKAQLYIMAELAKIGLREETATVTENGEKPYKVTLLRRIKLPILNDGKLDVVDGKYNADFVAIRIEGNGHDNGYRAVEPKFVRKLQEIYAMAANIYNVKVPKIT